MEVNQENKKLESRRGWVAVPSHLLWCHPLSLGVPSLWYAIQVNASPCQNSSILCPVEIKHISKWP